MAGLLSSTGSISSMRFSLILISIGVFMLMLAASVYIVAAAITPEMDEPSWASIGGFAVGMATVVTGIGYTKVQQKKIEQEKSELEILNERI